MSGIGPEAEVDEHALLGFDPSTTKAVSDQMAPLAVRRASATALSVRLIPAEPIMLEAATDRIDSRGRHTFVCRASRPVRRKRRTASAVSRSFSSLTSKRADQRTVLPPSRPSMANSAV
jgi:hypothetical protein